MEPIPTMLREKNPNIADTYAPLAKLMGRSFAFAAAIGQSTSTCPQVRRHRESLVAAPLLHYSNSSPPDDRSAASPRRITPAFLTEILHATKFKSFPLFAMSSSGCISPAAKFVTVGKDLLVFVDFGERGFVFIPSFRV